MAWRLAYSLATLRAEINAAAPNRSKISDGTIGDPRHQASASDHNPNDWDVVCAFDFTHDPAGGLDAHALADQLRLQQYRHPQLKYIISSWRIASARSGWAWRPYGGKNGHTSHVHVSVGEGPSGASRLGTYDSTASWRVAELLDLEFSAPPSRPRRTATVELPILAQATHGRTFDGAVVSLQALLNEKAGQGLVVDGWFGDRTEAAVKNVQQFFKLKVDGWVGPATWPTLFH